MDRMQADMSEISFTNSISFLIIGIRQDPAVGIQARRYEKYDRVAASEMRRESFKSIVIQTIALYFLLKQPRGIKAE